MIESPVVVLLGDLRVICVMDCAVSDGFLENGVFSLQPAVVLSGQFEG